MPGIIRDMMAVAVNINVASYVLRRYSIAAPPIPVMIPAIVIYMFFSVRPLINIPYPIQIWPIVSFIKFFAPLFLLFFMKSLPAAHLRTGTENHRKFHTGLLVVLKTSHTAIDTASKTVPQSIIGVAEFLSKPCDHNANTNKLRI